MINFSFIIIYILCAPFLDGTELYTLLTIHFLFLVIKTVRTTQNAISPIFVYYLGVIIVNIANIYLISLLNSGMQLKTYGYIIPKYINEAAFIWCISNTMFSIGYKAFSTKSFPKINIELYSMKVYYIIFGCLIMLNIVYILGDAYYVRGNQISKLTVLFNTIGILFFARIWGKYNNFKFMLFAITLFILETYLSLLYSFLRFELILPTFYLFTGYFIGKGHYKYLLSYRILPFIAIIFIYSNVFYMLGGYRTHFISVFTNSQQTDQEIPVDVSNPSSSLLTRSANVAQITNVIKLVDKNNGPYWGRASAPILTALIPRFLWPDKPIIQLGAWFALEAGLANKNEEGYVNNSVNMTVCGELYLDFGWFGVFIGSFLFGGLVSALWNCTQFYSSEFNLTGTIFGGYLIMLSIGSYADLQIAVTLLSTYLLFLLTKNIFLFFSKKKGTR